MKATAPQELHRSLLDSPAPHSPAAHSPPQSSGPVHLSLDVLALRSARPQFTLVATGVSILGSVRNHPAGRFPAQRQAPVHARRHRPNILGPVCIGTAGSIPPHADPDKSAEPAQSVYSGSPCTSKSPPSCEKSGLWWHVQPVSRRAAALARSTPPGAAPPSHPRQALSSPYPTPRASRCVRSEQHHLGWCHSDFHGQCAHSLTRTPRAFHTQSPR